jgi:hypothetical protein
MSTLFDQGQSCYPLNGVFSDPEQKSHPASATVLPYHSECISMSLTQMQPQQRPDPFNRICSHKLRGKAKPAPDRAGREDRFVSGGSGGT